MRILKSFFYVGVYDPLKFESWPYFFDEGIYLSTNKRMCSFRKAISFETPNEAREFYHAWLHKENHRLEVVELKEWVDIADPDYPENHPRSIIKSIKDGEKSSRLVIAALLWISGADPAEHYSDRTKSKYRKKLLEYGIDIFNPPSAEMVRLWTESKPEKYSDYQFMTTAKPRLIK
ncbi:hypothetical protein FGKAn22_10240 [Ferrigenium kumadai]|uniref:Uncharacterized protein n=1 Tax=Ferrigenium kumadai TaxID=1682490 RepID=A0AAN1SZ55_9PROT|nr:hypothetical protein [Ferrigenium kumadai]BBI99331.1 hypothetical protein FGKAn22_10240 [Ferrigenium kumadai]